MAARPAFLAVLAALIASALAVCPEVVRQAVLARTAARQYILAGQTSADAPLLDVSAVISDHTGTCSATVLNDRFLLTAAHCDYAPGAAVRVAVRRNRGETDAKVLKFLKHPLYTGKSILHDIAVVEIDPPLSGSPRVRLHVGPPVPPGTFVRAAGYGVDRPDFKSMPVGKAGMGVFRRVDLPVVSTADCKKRLTRNNIQLPPEFTNENYVCAGFIDPGHCGGDTCVGDSGGPIVVKRGDGGYVQVGLTSAGSGCGGASNLPGIYTNVGSHAGWVKKTAGSVLTADAFGGAKVEKPPKEAPAAPVEVSNPDKGGKPPTPSAPEAPASGKPAPAPADPATSTTTPSDAATSPADGDASSPTSAGPSEGPESTNPTSPNPPTDASGTPANGTDAGADASAARGSRRLSRGGTVALIAVFSLLGVAVLAIVAFFAVRAVRGNANPRPTAPAPAAGAGGAPPAERAPVLLVPGSAGPGTGGAAAAPPPAPPAVAPHAPPAPPPVAPPPPPPPPMAPSALPAPPAVLPAPPPVVPGPSNV